MPVFEGKVLKYINLNEEKRKMTTTVPHIVYASDDNFAWILGVSLTSLYENNKDLPDIRVYILDGGMSRSNHQRLITLAKSFERTEPIFITAHNIAEELSMNIAVDRGSLTQYGRLFISADLPRTLDRILYLDCDTIVRSSILPLWNLDMHGATVSALMDAFSKSYRSNINIQPEDLMFNSGVMLIDLKRWKSNHIEEKLKTFIKSKKGKVQQGDQGALNAVLTHDCYCFEPKYNAVTIFFDFSYKEMLVYRKPPKYYSEELVEESVEHPVIVHFTTSFLSKRPWMKDCKHKYCSEWLQYKALSPWKDKELIKDPRPEWKKIGAKMIKFLPRSLGIRIASFFQVVIRPVYNGIK